MDDLAIINKSSEPDELLMKVINPSHVRNLLGSDSEINFEPNDVINLNPNFKSFFNKVCDIYNLKDTTSDVKEEHKNFFSKMRNIIQNKKFEDEFNKILIIIIDQNSDLKLLIKNIKNYSENTQINDLNIGGKKNKTKKNKTKKNKTKKNKTKKRKQRGGGINISASIIFLIIFFLLSVYIASQSISNVDLLTEAGPHPETSFSDLIDALWLYPKTFAEQIIIPIYVYFMSGVFTSGPVVGTTKQILGIPLILMAAFLKTIKDLLGNPLALNGLWATYDRVQKIKDIVFPKKIEKINEIITDAANRTAQLMITNEPNNLVFIELPPDSKLLIKSDSTEILRNQIPASSAPA